MNTAHDLRHLLEPADLALPAGLRVPVPWARVELGVRWPHRLDAHVLLAAVGTEMQRRLGTLYHADWLGRDPDTGECIHRRPVVRYDLSTRRPVMWMDGPLAHDHAAAAARYLHAVVLPAGERREIAEVKVDHGVHVVGVHRRRLYSYALATPYFPSHTVSARQPAPAWAKRAWAGEALRSSISDLLAEWGGTPESPVTVQVEEGRAVPVRWSRPGRGEDRRLTGFTATFTSPVSLPPGTAVGAHTREGWGRLELIGEVALR